MMPPLIIVIYDSITNSVFDGQVLKPVIAQLTENPDLSAHIISYETSSPAQKTIAALAAQHKNLHIHILQKLPYIGQLSLTYAAWHIKKILSKHSKYSLRARGPMAGYICTLALQKNACKSLLIQARGLLAAEYEYAHAHEKNYIKKIIHRIRCKQFSNLEKVVYTHHQTVPTIIEAVSPALKEYLIATFGTQAQCITIAREDLPPQFSDGQTSTWKTAMRAQLGIAHDAIVYCYNGSIKPWQCPQETIAYFLEKKAVEPRAFLLVLTQDQEEFEKLIIKNKIPQESYGVLRVPHTDIYRYLAAGDVGLLFRHPHIINWTSRPTKILEYHASGLSIEHNNTVAWLIQPPENMLSQTHGITDCYTQSDY